jgi:hypothetical protein
MGILTPDTQGVLQARVNFDKSPPVTISPRIDQNYVFNKREIKGQSVPIVAGQNLESLPEAEGLYGIILKSKQIHHDNFLFLRTESTNFNDIEQFFGVNRNVNGNGMTLIFDKSGFVNKYSEEEKEEEFYFFGWKVIDSLYSEYSSPSRYGQPSAYLMHLNEEEMRGIFRLTNAVRNDPDTFPEFDEKNNKRFRGQKWEYRFVKIPTEQKYKDSVNIENINVLPTSTENEERDENSAFKLVPTQIQLQGPENGPTGIGVHWALEKIVPIPDRIGFYLDFYINKDADKLNKPPPSNSQQQFSVGLFNRMFTESFPQSGYKNESIYSGSKKWSGNFFNFIGHSYLMINIVGSFANNYILVIRDDANPRLYQYYRYNEHILGERVEANEKTVGEIRLIGEYNPPSGGSSGITIGEKMLAGLKGNLKLLVRNFYGNIVIENNVFETPWIIKVNPVSKNDGEVRIPHVGGRLQVFGGNLPCGVSYCPVSYEDTGNIILEPHQVFGPNRVMGTFFDNYSSKYIPEIMKTGNRYYPNSARLIKDRRGTTELGWRDPPSRTDVLTSGTGYIDRNCEPTKLIAVDDVGTREDNFSVLNTKIEIHSGDVYARFGQKKYFYKNCVTPILQFARQISDKSVYYTKREPIDIGPLIESIEITKSAEEFNSISVSGSINVNVHSPSIDEDARRKVLQSIGKARYLDISARFICNEADDHGNNIFEEESPFFGYGKLFTGIAFNPVLQEEAGRRFVKFDLKDYWTILESKLILNSPFFDGAIDTSVVKYLLDYTGLLDENYSLHTGSRDIMPISFDFANPLSKFEDQSNVADNIKTLAKKYTKYAFFDANGVLRYNRSPEFVVPSSGRILYKPLFEFFSTHMTPMNINIASVGPGQQSTGRMQLLDNSQIAYETKTTVWTTEEVFNKIILNSIDAGQGLGSQRGWILIADTNYDSLLNGDVQGFLGYERTFIQNEALIGSLERAEQVVRYYTRMYKPIYSITWKTRGKLLKKNDGSGRYLDIFDIVSVDGKLVYITKISHQLDAKSNKWEINWEGEWIWPPDQTFNPDRLSKG